MSWTRMSLRPCGLRETISTGWLSEICFLLADIAGPIFRQQAFSDVAVKRRIGPVAYTLCQSMFDGIEMDIIDMPRKVAVVADGVLPKSPLPEREVAIGPALEMKPRLDQGAAEMPLDSPPAAGKICILC